MKRLLIVVAFCLLTLGATVASAQNDPCMQKGGIMTDGKCMLTLDAKISVDYPHRSGDPERPNRHHHRSLHSVGEERLHRFAEGRFLSRACSL